MTETLAELLKSRNTQAFATGVGSQMHTKLQRVFLPYCVDDDIVVHIKKNPDLARIFDNLSQTEVPIAGKINGRFISRRIDRLRIDNENKIIDILDYKTDTDYTLRRAHYVAQIGEYRALLADIYPKYTIRTYILWTHDWTLEKI